MTLLDVAMKSHLKSEHAIFHYSPAKDESSGPKKGSVDNLRNRKQLLSAHAVVHKIIVSLGQKYGGIRGANPYVAPNGLGVCLPNVSSTPAMVKSVEYSHWKNETEVGDFSQTLRSDFTDYWDVSKKAYHSWCLCKYYQCHKVLRG